ncbi:hypothetical protein Leryth_023098 [Lithospermum erythrorhizon]|nr:hypothetical protein Leryth_023098 [Lithospermum erythrorhizon]
MKTTLSSETMEIPGVKIKINARIISVSVPRGTLIHNFKHLNLDCNDCFDVLVCLRI